MKKINKRIEIVSSSIPSLSSMSEKSYLLIQQELSKHYEQVDISLVDSEEDLEHVIEKSPDLVFLGMKRIPRKVTVSNSAPFVWISEYFENRGIPCTGSPADAIRLEEEKADAKAAVRKAGLNTADFFVTYSGRHINKSQLPLTFPLFVKPPNLGGGQGIGDDSVVNTFKEYKTKIISLEENHSSEALVEDYLTGREFTVAVLKNDTEGYTVMPLEIIAEPGVKGVQVLGSAVKINDSEQVVPVEEQQLAERLTILALDVFDVLGARDYGRVDIRMDDNDVPNFLEANLIPSLIEDYGNFQKACELVSGISYKDMLLRIVDLAFARPPIDSISAKPAAELVTS